MSKVSSGVRANTSALTMLVSSSSLASEISVSVCLDIADPDGLYRRIGFTLRLGLRGIGVLRGSAPEPARLRLRLLRWPGVAGWGPRGGGGAARPARGVARKLPAPSGATIWPLYA